MPQFERAECLARPIEEVFDFFIHPANLVLVAPPELHMKVAEAPATLQLGSRLVIKGRRWGVPHQVVSEVIAFEPNVSFVDEQIQGPFARWVHTHRFESVPEGTRIHDHIDFAPPTGLLGLIVSAAFIQKDLEWIFAYRTDKLRELLGACQAR